MVSSCRCRRPVAGPELHFGHTPRIPHQSLHHFSVRQPASHPCIASGSSRSITREGLWTWRSVRCCESTRAAGKGKKKSSCCLLAAVFCFALLLFFFSVRPHRKSVHTHRGEGMRHLRFFCHALLGFRQGRVGICWHLGPSIPGGGRRKASARERTFPAVVRNKKVHNMQ